MGFFVKIGCEWEDSTLTHSAREYFEKLPLKNKQKTKLSTVISQKLGRIQSQN